jgi:hypothetical protein
VALALRSIFANVFVGLWFASLGARGCTGATRPEDEQHNDLGPSLEQPDATRIGNCSKRFGGQQYGRTNRPHGGDIYLTGDRSNRGRRLHSFGSGFQSSDRTPERLWSRDTYLEELAAFRAQRWDGGRRALDPALQEMPG